MSQVVTRPMLDARDKRYRTTLVNSLSGFKSANLLGTADAHGRTNLALISSVIHVGANPPLLGMLMRPHTVPRHSLENLLASGQYTLNAVSEGMVSAAHGTSARFARETSEFDATGLTPAFRDGWSAPRVAESPLQIDLALSEHHTLGNETVLVVGEIVEFRVTGALADDGYLDLEALSVVTISSLDAYHRTEALGRQAYAKPGNDTAPPTLQAHRTDPQ